MTFGSHRSVNLAPPIYEEISTMSVQPQLQMPGFAIDSVYADSSFTPPFNGFLNFNDLPQNSDWSAIGWDVKEFYNGGQVTGGFGANGPSYGIQMPSYMGYIGVVGSGESQGPNTQFMIYVPKASVMEDPPIALVIPEANYDAYIPGTPVSAYWFKRSLGFLGFRMRYCIVNYGGTSTPVSLNFYTDVSFTGLISTHQLTYDSTYDYAEWYTLNIPVFTGGATCKSVRFSGPIADNVSILIDNITFINPQ